MATVIRMRRGGRTHKPYYRIVVQDSRARDRGPEIDSLGVYQPCARPEPIVEVDVPKTLDWLRKGAQMSDTAHSVLGKLGVLKHFNDGTNPEAAAPAE
jgi:small subunit ribosomal protein S16